MRLRMLSFALATLCCFSMTMASPDGASRKLLQMDLAGLLGGGGTLPLQLCCMVTLLIALSVVKVP